MYKNPLMDIDCEPCENLFHGLRTSGAVGALRRTPPQGYKSDTYKKMSIIYVTHNM